MRSGLILPPPAPWLSRHVPVVVTPVRGTDAYQAPREERETARPPKGGVR